MRHADFLHRAMPGSGTDRKQLFPEIEPFRTGWLKVSKTHDVYFEECGSPAGKPVLIVHGGPGGGCNPAMRRYHDPARYRIILFDQRGCGRSTPHACLNDNTTWDLVADMERLRVHLGVEAWQLCGGSWGSTLSLAYAETHPERVTELLLRGIFLLRKAELDWFYQEGCSWIFPDAYETYAAAIPGAERGNMIEARAKVRKRQLCARLCAHRMPLFHQQGLLPKRQSAHRGCGPDRACSRHDHSWPLRRCHADQERLGSG
jgi:proline iminopeptidase